MYQVFPSNKPILKLPYPRGYTDCASWRSSGKSKPDNNKGSRSCLCLPISHASIRTVLYTGHASRARIMRELASRPPVHTINHSREGGNGSLHCISDIVHSVFYKLQCCSQHPLTSEAHDPREGAKLVNRSVYLWAAGVRLRKLHLVSLDSYSKASFPRHVFSTVKSLVVFLPSPRMIDLRNFSVLKHCFQSPFPV